MMKWIIGFIIQCVVIFGAARLLPGVEIKGFKTAVVVAVLLAIVNLILGNLLHALLWIPNILTLGLLKFLFGWLISWIINAIVIKVVDALVGDFKVNGFGWALIYSAVISIGTTILMKVF